jgi:hypothetical protein
MTYPRTLADLATDVEATVDRLKHGGETAAEQILEVLADADVTEILLDYQAALELFDAFTRQQRSDLLNRARNARGWADVARDLGSIRFATSRPAGATAVSNDAQERGSSWVSFPEMAADPGGWIVGLQTTFDVPRHRKVTDAVVSALVHAAEPDLIKHFGLVCNMWQRLPEVNQVGFLRTVTHQQFWTQVSATVARHDSAGTRCPFDEPYPATAG